MIKMSVFNKTNDALIDDTFKNVFQRTSSEVFKPDVPEFGTIQICFTVNTVSHFVHVGWPLQKEGKNVSSKSGQFSTCL